MKHTTSTFGKKSIPLGLNKVSFFRKLKDPNAKKPWQAINILSTGSIDVTPSWGSNTNTPSPLFEPTPPSTTTSQQPHQNKLAMPPQGLLGMPTDYSVLLSTRRRQLQQQGELEQDKAKSKVVGSSRSNNNGGRKPPSLQSSSRPRDILRQLNRNEIEIDSMNRADESFRRLNDGFEEIDTPPPHPSSSRTGRSDGGLIIPKDDEDHSPLSLLDPVSSVSAAHNVIAPRVKNSSSSSLSEFEVRREGTVAERAGVPSATIPMGDKLNITIDDVVDNRSGPVPLPLQNLTRSGEKRRDNVRLSGNLDKLFKKIMKWNEDLQELREEDDGAVVDNEDYGRGDPNESPSQLRLRPQLQPAKKYEKMGDKLKYGALMTPMENDKFALENKLIVAGRSFEKTFSNWAAKNIVDSAVEEKMDEVNANKSSMILDQTSMFKIPKMNHDCCSGCGSIFQAADEDQFGYVKPGSIENYIVVNSRIVKARSEYGDRMAELQAHWDKNGKRVGEEWLDFMTDEEFRAIYRHKDRPFVCNRCLTLSHSKGPSVLLKAHPTLTAPDFTEKLQALREKRCLVVLVCDITDFPGSMVYDLPGLISMNNPILIVLNKLDCIQQRAPGYTGSASFFRHQAVTERYIREWALGLTKPFNIPKHLIKEVLPVSAKRGWNVSRLIESIERHSNLNMASSAPVLPTYFVGVSNVGKSMLLNSIAHSVFRPEAPHPLSKKTYYTERDPKTGKDVILFRWTTPKGATQGDAKYMKSFRTKEASTQLTVSNLPGTTVETTAIRVSLSGMKKAKSGRSDKSDLTVTNFFDTPGLHPHWYHTSPLTLLELGKAVITDFRNPPCYLLKEGFTFHFGGVAAIDVMKASCESIVIAAYSSTKTQHGAVKSEKSETFWAEELGNKLTPPYALEELAGLRLSVKKSYMFECYGRHKTTPKADIYFCGLGWVSFYTSNPTDLVIRVRTLPGIVHGVREPLRKNDMKARGKWPVFIPGSNSPFDALPSIRQIVRLTNKPIEDEEEANDDIGSTSGGEHPAADNNNNNSSAVGKSGGGGGVIGGVKPVLKARAPSVTVGSNDPLDALEKELGESMSF